MSAQDRRLIFHPSTVACLVSHAELLPALLHGLAEGDAFCAWLLADWLEEQGDERAGAVREAIHQVNELAAVTVYRYRRGYFSLDLCRELVAECLRGERTAPDVRAALEQARRELCQCVWELFPN